MFDAKGIDFGPISLKFLRVDSVGPLFRCLGFVNSVLGHNLREAAGQRTSFNAHLLLLGKTALGGTHISRYRSPLC